MINLERAYDHAASTDGERFLVERLWPRGVKKTALHVRAWLKDVAPSTSLRRWFGHDPPEWNEATDRTIASYARMKMLWNLFGRQPNAEASLLCTARDTEHNNAVALKDYLKTKIGKR